MSIDINDIYVRQWLVNDELKLYCSNPKHNFYIINPHFVCHIEDSINFKALVNNDFRMYCKYVILTNQLEHSVFNYKKLIKNFDINRMKKITIQFNKSINKYEVRDGVHRLSILLFNKIIKNNKIPLKYLNIIT